ncbi:MAG: DegT/DnrJ/EryC1/StrS family aminotransferase [Chitinophagales bacterium]|nr:DegT/DnrJ/EryC1/StrS family aminotransferase [Chitinophagales bacterium]
MIPFVDLKHIHQPLLKEFQNIQDTCLKNSDFVTGQLVNQFEEEFAAYCQSKYCIGVSSGTAALFLALKALNIQAGDEVIVPAHTFIATAMAVSQCGAKVIFADVNPDTWNLTWEKIESKITQNTKAIIVVHIYGNPVDISPICQESKKRNIFVIEDAAQAHGATYKGRKIGSLADLACFSFYPSKNLGALGEGGAITTQNEEWAHKILQLRDYGRSDKYKHEFIGYNLRLQALQAGFLSVKLPHLDHWNQERRRLISLYQEYLKDTPISFQVVLKNAQSVYHLGVIRCADRDKITQSFTKNNIGYGIHYPIACHQQTAYSIYNSLSLPIAESLSQQTISLPLYIGLKDEELRHITSILTTALSLI